MTALSVISSLGSFSVTWCALSAEEITRSRSG